MRRSLRHALRRALAASWVIAPLALLSASDSKAQGVDSKAAPPASVGSVDEEQTLALYHEEKLLTARTRAQAILDRNPSSVIGHYVLGSVLRDAEGSLPRSRAHLLEARRLWKQRGPVDGAAPGGPATRLGAEILWGLMRTTSLMDDYAGQLKLLDEYDQEYTPKRPAHHAWPLMKLLRYDEARAFAREGVASGNVWNEITGLNALCAIEGEDHQRQAYYDGCKRAFDWAKEHHDNANLAVHGYNASLGALNLLRYDEAERFALAGTKYMEEGASNPWRHLAELYTTEGRTDDAVGALREMQVWCAAQPPQYRDQKSAETFATIASVLLAAGDAGTGLHFINRALERPDRRAVTSAHPEQSFGGGAMLRRALYLLDAEQHAERGSARGLKEEAEELAAAAEQRALAAVDDERVISTLADDQRIVFTLRPYTEGALEPGPTWMTGDLVAIAGAGVTSAALARARQEDAAHPEMDPFFDAIDAEVALAQRSYRRALEIATITFDRLPRAEALLRARVAAVGAEAAAQAHLWSESVGLFEKALALDPGVVRRLRVAIPARVEAHGALAERAGKVIARSPRIQASSAGFVVRVEGDDARLRACLLTPSGSVLGCGTAEAAAGESKDAMITRLADDFHHAAFAMKFSLTPTDLRSLDGSTTAAQGSARDAFRDLFQQF